MKPLIITLLVIAAAIFDTGGIFTYGELFSMGLTLVISGIAAII